MEIRDRLAFTTLGCPQWSIEEIAAAARSLGYSSVEIRGVGPEVDLRKIECLQPQNQAATLAVLKKNAVRLCGLGASATFHEPDGYDAAVEEGLAAVELCGEMKIPFVRVFGDAFREGEDRAETLRRVARGITALCEAADEGVTVLLEVHGQFNHAGALAELIQAMRGVDSFGILWDLEHSFFAHGNDIEPLYDTIAPLVRHVHVKDCVRRGAGYETRLPGQGEIDIPKIVRLLENGGYTGLYSFEWEKRWLPELAPAKDAFPQYVAYMSDLCNLR